MIWHNTKYTGVRYRKHPKRNVKRRADRYITIRYHRQKMLIGEAVGWESDGATIEEAVKLRSQIIHNIRLGEGFQSIREKREREEDKRLSKAKDKETAKKEKLSLDSLAKDYLDWAKENKKSWEADETRYRLHIKPELGKRSLNQISIIQIERLKKKLKSKKKSPQTILHCMQLIRAMYNRATGWGLYQGVNPIQATTKIDEKFLKIPDSSRKRFLTFEEAKTLMGELKERSTQLHDIALVSLHTGARAGEIFNLKGTDIDLNHKIITLSDTKNGETRQAYMTPPVETMFEERNQLGNPKTDLVFKNRNGEKIREVSNAFEGAVKKLGFNKDISDRRDKLVFHSLRHTFASWLALQGETLLTIMELMGHKDIKMTLRYAHLIPDQKKKAVLKLAENHKGQIKTSKAKQKPKCQNILS
ncbi:MAG: tyrosine-type recombinase/integrase [Alphaproteobacteria bacterium]|nr:tyrosine-type recombinase/integrase [Alphaproteobacteria bacterium]